MHMYEVIFSVIIPFFPRFLFDIRRARIFLFEYFFLMLLMLNKIPTKFFALITPES